MSRVGKQPISIPSGVSVKLHDNVIEVKGPKGQLDRQLSDNLDIEIIGDTVKVSRRDDEWRSKSLHGLTRSLVANMITGVSSGFSKSLEIQGRGYRANVEGEVLIVEVGFSHPIRYQMPEGINIEVESNTNIVVMGVDKEQVGQVAAKIRAFRPPEPYQGKGIRYRGEYIARKAGKKNV